MTTILWPQYMVQTEAQNPARTLIGGKYRLFSAPIKTMAIAWSKTVPYTCYELGHCWTPSCKQAFADIAIDGFKYSLKVYGTLYLVGSWVIWCHFYDNSVNHPIASACLSLSLSSVVTYTRYSLKPKTCT